jgi:hypothetical protein
VNRQNTVAKSYCQTFSDFYGINSLMAECGGATSTERCEFTYNWTRNALCGAGLEFAGTYGRIQGNAAFDNGTPGGVLADGITIRHNNNGIVNDNRAVNNTRYGISVGGARNAQIQSNWIQQPHVFAKAGLHLGYRFRSSGAVESGDFTNTTIRYNTIDCFGLNCAFGLNLGHDPFVTTDQANIYGGTASQNNINGARVLVNFGGAGTSTNRTTVTNNTLTNPPTSWVPLAPGSSCYAAPNVLQNLPNNNSTGVCGNFANADAIPTSTICFLGCLP